MGWALRSTRQMIVVWESLILRANQWLAQCVPQWVAQLALAYLKLVLIAKTDLPTHATLATHDGHSLQNMMTASCTFIISAEPCHIATWLCDARGYSMISTIVSQPSSAPSVLHPKAPRMRVAFSATLVGISTSARAARARSQVYLSHRGLSGT